MNSVMSRGKKRSEIDDLFGDLLGDDDDLGESRSPSPPVARKGKKVDVYDDAFYEQLAKDNGLEVRRRLWDLELLPVPHGNGQTVKYHNSGC